jgi:hypothetical protein
LDKDVSKFNKFAPYAKFNTMFYGGFDGLNIFDRNAYYMNDKATSTEAGGYAGSSGISNGLGITGSDNGDLMGLKLDNGLIQSYRIGVDILNSRYKGIHHLLSIPGIREPLITDYAAKKTKEFQFAMYVMDIPNYDEDGTRMFIGDSTIPNVGETASAFNSRKFDNNYTATYFPDVIMLDEINNNRNIKVPASIAAVSALSLSDTSKGGAVWFAPAGFSRGALSTVKNIATRLTTADRDELYENNINPIANFPSAGFKIWGQKTCQRSKSALDRINVRRMLLEVKRKVLQVARQLLFSRNNPALRQTFIGQISPSLSFIQMNQGIEKFKIIMDDTNNTAADAREYRLNGTILVVPTRAIEFVSVEFIIDADGVTFK